MTTADQEVQQETDIPGAIESVVVVDYDPARLATFQSELATLEQLFAGTHARIEHVGSTAIEGLGGKPIVDIMVGLQSLHDAENRTDWLAEYGYAYMPEYEASIPDRRFFRKPATGSRQVHLHCVPEDSEFFRDHVVFRDYLRAHPEKAQEYFELKVKLADTLGHDRDAYTNAKTEFIEDILKQAADE